MKRSILAGLTLAFGFLALSVNTGHASTIAQLDLTQRLQNGCGFEGEVTKVNFHKHPNGWDVVDYTFRVDDVVKPCAVLSGKEATFTTINPNSIKGLPGFSMGDRGIFLFYVPNAQTGLTSNVGWEQGVFKYNGTSGTTVQRTDPMMKLKSLKLKPTTATAAGTSKNLELTTKSLRTLQNVSQSPEGQVTISGEDLKSVMKGIVNGDIEQGQGGQQ